MTAHLVPEYHRARLVVVVSSALVFLWWLEVPVEGRIPVLNVDLKDLSKAPYLLACVLTYGLIRLLTEWAQSESERRRRLASRLDLCLTLLLGGIAAALLGFRLLRSVDLPTVSPVSAFALVVLGIATGEWTNLAIFDLFLLRSREEARRLALPRVPAAVRANLRMGLIVLPCLILVLCLTPSFSPPMSHLWPWFLLSPIAILLTSGMASLALRRHMRPDGTVVSRKDFIKSLRWIFDRHDVEYQLGGWDKRIPPSNTPLYQAAERGNTEAVRELLTGGTNPDEPNRHGWTALMIAVANHHREAAMLLLDHAADPNRSNLLGRNALMFAARYGSEDLVRELLQHGAKPDFNESDDSSALSSAAASGHVRVVELLLSAGADPTQRDHGGRSAQEHAEAAGHGEIAAILRRSRLQREQLGKVGTP